MKKLNVILFFIAIGLSSVASANQAECGSNAIKSVAKRARVDINNVAVYNAELIGDGASAVEAIALKVVGQDGFWILTMNYDDCSVFQKAKRINN